MGRAHWLWTGALLVLVAAFSWRPVYRDQILLQHVPTALGLVTLWLVARRPGLSTRSFVSVLAFLALHVIGARWVYSQVPYDAWAESVFGTSLSETFGWRRNHYDRLVHLAFGVLLVGTTCELVRRTLDVSDRAGWLLAVTFIIAASAVYEFAEWALAVTTAPETADRYLGQQGDIWDAHKDMALASLGALVVAMARQFRVAVSRAPSFDR